MPDAGAATPGPPAIGSALASSLGPRAVTGAAIAAAILFGALLPWSPAAAVGLVVLVPLALFAPVAHLAAILFVTVLVPFDVQNQLSVGGGAGVPGLLAIDVLLLLGLARVGALVALGRLTMTRPVALAAALGLLLAAALLHGAAAGADLGEVGSESRRMAFAVGTFVLAWPILEDPAGRARLRRLLPLLGLALAAWGLAQWLLQVGFTSSADVGVRPGVDETSSGRGSLQGGLYAYPVAVTLAFAALVSTRSTDSRGRVLAGAIFGLNLICLLLTYERTLWAATAVACAVVVVRSGRAAWRPAAVAVAATAALGLLALLALAPGELRTAAERVASVSESRTDESLVYRIVESEAVAGAIVRRPLLGSGFGATVTWGKRNTFRTITTPFAHNGYLWLAWKVGLPLALLVVAAIGALALRRGPPLSDPSWASLRVGGGAALVGILLTNVMFPTLNSLVVSAVTGLLLALCVWPSDGVATRVAAPR